jgi:hypothetical protein
MMPAWQVTTSNTLSAKALDSIDVVFLCAENVELTEAEEATLRDYVHAGGGTAIVCAPTHRSRERFAWLGLDVTEAAAAAAAPAPANAAPATRLPLQLYELERTVEAGEIQNFDFLLSKNDHFPQIQAETGSGHKDQENPKQKVRFYAAAWLQSSSVWGLSHRLHFANTGETTFRLAPEACGFALHGDRNEVR